MKKNIPLYCFVVLICTSIVLAFVLNFYLVIDPFKKLDDEDYTFEKFTDDTQKQYTSNFFARESFINLNGLFTRLIGKKTTNNVDKMKNGMLVNSNIIYRDTSNLANSIKQFNSHLKENDVKFVYIQLPMKVDLENSLIYDGYVNYANQNANELLGKLGNDVSFIDMRKYIVSTPEQVEKYFYRTDHHWNTYGAFEAYKVVLNYLDEEFSEQDFDLSNADINNWNATVYEDWFLGSLGKRVGKLYAGVDDLTLLTPKFDTDMSMYVTNHRKFFNGNFENAVMDNSYLDKRDYFHENPYCSYIGGDYPLVNHINNNASNDLKVLIIKDSFSLPLQAFLSTSVKELDVIDARYFTECTIAEYVNVSKPDIVIMSINPSVFGETKYQKFGIDEASYHTNQTEKIEIVKNQSFKLQSNGDYYYKAVLSGLSYNTKYTVSFDNINCSNEGVDGVTVALYNKDTQKIISSYVFNLDFCKQNGFEWSFVTPDIKSGNLQILVYAGLHSQTKGNTVEYQSLTVYKYE